MVEVLCYHVECLIRSISDHKEVSSIAKSKDSRLHVSWVEGNLVNVGKLEIVAQEIIRKERQEVCILGELFIGEEALGVFFGPAGAHEVSADGVQLILTSNNENVSPGEGHLRLTNLHKLDIDRRTVNFL